MRDSGLLHFRDDDSCRIAQYAYRDQRFSASVPNYWRWRKINFYWCLVLVREHTTRMKIDSTIDCNAFQRLRDEILNFLSLLMN